MAIQQVISVYLNLKGDGAASTFSFALQNLYQFSNGIAVPFGGAGVVPTAISANNPPVPVTSVTTDANGNITLTTTSPLPANVYTFQLDLTFASGSSTSSSPTQTTNVTVVGSSATQLLDSGGTNKASISAGGALKVDGSAVTQPVSGTVTANAGTGSFTVAQGTAANLNATVVGTGTFAVQATQSGTWTVQPGNTANTTAWLVTGTGGTFPVTGTIAATQSGNWTSRIVGNGGAVLDFAGQNASSPANAILIGAQFNTTPTTITSGNASPLQLDSAGNLLVNVKAGSSGNAAASATGSAVPASASYTGVNIAGNLVGVTGFSLTNSKAMATAIVDASGNQITSFGGGSQFAMGSAQSSSALGTIALGYDGTNVRGLSTNSSGQLNVIFPSAQAVTLASTTITGTVATTQSGTWTNTVTQATASNLNATVVGTGTFAVQAAQSGTWNIGTLTTVTNPVTVVGDSASGASNAGNPVKIGGAFNTTQPTVTNGQTVDAQMTARGAQIVATGVDTFTVAVSGTAAVTQSGTWNIGTLTTITNAVTVSQATAANLNATVTGTVAATQSGTWTNTVTQATAANLNATVVQATGSNLHVVVDSGTITASAGALADLVGSTGTLNALNAAATINAFGYLAVGGFLAAGTLIGTIVPEVSFDGGTTWTSTYFDTGNKVPSIVFGSANTATSFSIIGAAGASNYRVRVSAFTSGTASCTLRANEIHDPTLIFTGLVAATVQPPTIAQMGGWVTTAAPAYSTTTFNALSLTTGGGLRQDLASVNGTTVVTAASGVQKVGISGNAGASVDAAVNSGAAPANVIWTAHAPVTVSQGSLTAKYINSTASAVIKNSAGSLYGVQAISLQTTSTSAGTLFIHFFNTSTTTGLTTGTWLFSVPIPAPSSASTSAQMNISPGSYALANFSNGITVVVNATSTSNTTAGGTGVCAVFFFE